MGCELSPLLFVATFPEFPYVPFGQDSPSMNAAFRDVGEQRARRQVLSLLQKSHIVASYEKSGKHMDESMKCPRLCYLSRWHFQNVPTL